MRSLKFFCRLLLLFVVPTVVWTAAQGQTSASAADPPLDTSLQWMIAPFSRPAENPVIKPLAASIFRDALRPAPVHWEALHTFNPAAVVRKNKIYVLYRAEDDSGEMAIGGHTSRLGLAESKDGIHFKRHHKPVFFAAEDDQKTREWPGGVEDPRIVESEDGIYVMTYTQWNRETFSAAIATSRDLHHWQKYGPAFGSAARGKYSALRYKSAGIVTHELGGRLIAARIHNKYWMYWGEGAVHLATSDDLIHWQPVEDAAGEPIVVLEKRAGHFDSGFPEVGPPPVLTRDGIVVIYNGKNDPENGDKSLGANAYAAGQALFAADDPAKILARSASPFFKPEMTFEKTGQYVAGTTFVEGLVYFRQQWWLYYGCADSMVGVAMDPGEGTAIHPDTKP